VGGSHPLLPDLLSSVLSLFWLTPPIPMMLFNNYIFSFGYNAADTTPATATAISPSEAIVTAQDEIDTMLSEMLECCNTTNAIQNRF
jgi:hypothetical protein